MDKETIKASDVLYRIASDYYCKMLGDVSDPDASAIVEYSNKMLQIGIAAGQRLRGEAWDE